MQHRCEHSRALDSLVERPTPALAPSHSCKHAGEEILVAEIPARPPFSIQKYLPTKFLKAEGGVWPACGPGCFCFLFDIVAENCFGLFGPFPGPFGRISCWGYWRFFLFFFSPRIASFFFPCLYFRSHLWKLAGRELMADKTQISFRPYATKGRSSFTESHSAAESL